MEQSPREQGNKQQRGTFCTGCGPREGSDKVEIISQSELNTHVLKQAKSLALLNEARGRKEVVPNETQTFTPTFNCHKTKAVGESCNGFYVGGSSERAHQSQGRGSL